MTFNSWQKFFYLSLSVLLIIILGFFPRRIMTYDSRTYFQLKATSVIDKIGKEDVVWKSGPKFLAVIASFSPTWLYMLIISFFFTVLSIKRSFQDFMQLFILQSLSRHQEIVQNQDAKESMISCSIAWCFCLRSWILSLCLLSSSFCLWAIIDWKTSCLSISLFSRSPSLNCILLSLSSSLSSISCFPNLVTSSTVEKQNISISWAKMTTLTFITNLIGSVGRKEWNGLLQRLVRPQDAFRHAFQ